MSASQLPQEMIEAIVDQLYDDKLSLKACSLVCKNWTHAARLHLFYRLTLRWPLQPALFPFVRHLRIPLLRLQPPPWDEIIQSLVGFCRIVSLNIDLSWRSLDVISAKSWSTLVTNLSGVVSLSLICFSFANISAVARAICAFPSLRELSIRDAVPPRIFEPSSATTFRPSPHLHTLELDSPCLATVLEWLLPPALRTVRLQYVRNRDLPMLNKFIAAVGNNLESFTLSSSALDWIHDSIDTMPLTNLRSVYLVLRSRHDSNRWATQMLSQISSVQLEHVEFRLSSSSGALDVDLSGALEWSEVDAILQGSTFSRLRSVEVRCLGSTILGPNPRRSCSAFVVARLPLCHARGILSCVG